MFKKILIVESTDRIALGLNILLQHYNATISMARNADSAMLKIKSSDTPYDLIITSLAHTEGNGAHLNAENFICTLRAELPEIKIMVYSDDTHPKRIHRLFHECRINAFIAHEPEYIPQIADPVKVLYTAQIVFVSPGCAPPPNSISGTELGDFDIQLLKQLSYGKSQPEISELFIKQGTHASISTIEKRINKLRDFFQAVNTINLVALAKDSGII